MTDRQLHRYGEDNSVLAAVDLATVIEIGDLVYQETDDARNANALAWNTTLLITQNDFHDKFLGVAAQRSTALMSDDIRVAAEGVFEFDCASATFELGDLIGPAEISSKLEDQKVIGVAVEGAAIGRVAKRYGSATTKVLVRIVSTVASGGVQSAIT